MTSGGPNATSVRDVHDPPFEGDAAWRVERTLRDGTVITIRPIFPEDRDELRRAFHTVSPRTRYLRFLGAVGDLSDATLTYLTCVDQKEHVALVATISSPDLKSERGVGVARFIRLGPSSDTAEAAITVTDDMQRHGVGTALAVELERAARARGIRHIRADVLEGNAMMRSILEEAGAKRVDKGDGVGMLSYDLEITRNTTAAETLMDVFRRIARTMTDSIRSAAAPRQDEPEGGEGEA